VIRTRRNAPRQSRHQIQIRATLGRDLKWSAICSGCPLWTIDRASFREYLRERHSHTVAHRNAGQSVAI
jgi:hypothetical protein